MNEKDIILIKTIDAKMKAMLEQKISNEQIYVYMFPYMNDQLKHIISSNNEAKLNLYAQEYQGFYHYMRLLENIDYQVSNPR